MKDIPLKESSAKLEPFNVFLNVKKEGSSRLVEMLIPVPEDYNFGSNMIEKRESAGYVFLFVNFEQDKSIKNASSEATKILSCQYELTERPANSEGLFFVTAVYGDPQESDPSPGKWD